jgi:hypothetical protein
MYTKASNQVHNEKKNKSHRMIDEILNESKESFLNFREKKVSLVGTNLDLKL